MAVKRSTSPMAGTVVVIDYQLIDNRGVQNRTTSIPGVAVPSLDDIRKRIEAQVTHEEAATRARRAEDEALAALKGASWTFDV